MNWKGDSMKQQHDPNKTKHYKVYNESKPTYIRHKEVIEAIPKRCWWVRDYLKGIYTYRKQS